jgi:plasmid stabilization system protein ParE
VNPFTVDWSEGAIDELADIWNRATDRSAVTAAENSIERQLVRNPTGGGRHLGEGLYRLYDPPLLVFYEVDVANRTVMVVQVEYRP